MFSPLFFLVCAFKKKTVLQSCCADKRSVRFVREVSAYESTEGAIQIIHK